MSQKIAVTADDRGGIGPEIMEASLHIIQSAGYDIVKMEIPRNFDGQRGFTPARGQ